MCEGQGITEWSQRGGVRAGYVGLCRDYKDFVFLWEGSEPSRTEEWHDLICSLSLPLCCCVEKRLEGAKVRAGRAVMKLWLPPHWEMLGVLDQGEAHFEAASCSWVECGGEVVKGENGWGVILCLLSEQEGRRRNHCWSQILGRDKEPRITWRSVWDRQVEILEGESIVGTQERLELRGQLWTEI